MGEAKRCTQKWRHKSAPGWTARWERSGNVGVKFAGYLYCKLCRNGGRRVQSKAAKQIIKRRKASLIH